MLKSSILNFNDDQILKMLISSIDDTIQFSDKVWIAGGFPRLLYHHFFIKKYSNDEIVGHFFERSYDEIHHDLKKMLKTYHFSNADIDIFSDKSVNVEDLVSNNVIRKHISKSYGGFSKEFSILMKNNNNFEFDNFSKKFSYRTPRINIQLVDHEKLRYKTIEECLSNFDIVNSKYALHKNNDNQWILTYDENAVEKDEQKVISIQNNTSPMLGRRIIKYFLFKGCENGLDDESKTKFSDWVYKITGDDWELFDNSQVSHSMNSTLFNLHTLGFLKIEHIPLFLNRWTTSVKIDDSEEYGQTYQIDWAKYVIENFEKTQVINRAIR